MRGATRREFLRRFAAISAVTSGGAPLALNLAALGSASAQSASDYKALVCIFLNGGNDAYNTVLATDNASWAKYRAARDPAGILTNAAYEASGLPDPPMLLRADDDPPVRTQYRLANPSDDSLQPTDLDRLGRVLPLNYNGIAGRSFGLHPELAYLKGLFEITGELAILPNIGPLVVPLTRSEYLNQSKARPSKLFSHNDQTSVWHSFKAEGSTTGWGGLLADTLLDGGAASTFTAISPSGNAVWLAGHDVLPYHVGINGPNGFNGDPANGIYDSPLVRQTALSILNGSIYPAGTQKNYLHADLERVGKRALDSYAALKAAMDATAGDLVVDNEADFLTYHSEVFGLPKSNSLSRQLATVARIIRASQSQLGVKRQIFFVRLNGFDTHAAQNLRHLDLMRQLNQAIEYFQTLLVPLGLWDKVTTFTTSEFGRTFASNGDGTDHGWGGHHFVFGGSVVGGKMYGTFPTYGVLPTGGGANLNEALFDSDDQVNGGSLLPKHSVQQLAAALGVWMGASASDLSFLPNLSQFDSGVYDGMLA